MTTHLHFMNNPTWNYLLSGYILVTEINESDYITYRHLPSQKSYRKYVNLEAVFGTICFSSEINIINNLSIDIRCSHSFF
jgi:hypothetical protein